MKFFSSLALFASAVAANPVIHSTRQDTPATFTLKTTDASHEEHNNLYVYAYHTGAGFNDAVLAPDSGSASKAFLNGTYTQFDLNTPFPWGFNMITVTNYGEWEPVEINTGYGVQGFFIDSTGLQWDAKQGFGGWLVCDWYHGAPQLFYLYSYVDHNLPSTCSTVNLAVEYTS